MAGEVSMDGPDIRVSGKLIELVFHKDRGSFILATKDGRISFGPLHMRSRALRSDKRTINLDSSLLGANVAESLEELETPLGPAPGIRATVKADTPFEMIMELALPEDKPYALARLILVNRDRGPVKVYELCPMSYTGADPGLELGTGYANWRFYRTGFQSWSPAGSVSVMDHDYKPNFFLPRNAGANPRTGYSRKPGEKASDWMAQIVEKNQGLSLLAGFITSARQLGRLEFQVKYDRFRRLEAMADGDGALLDQDREMESEWLMISLADDALASQEEYYRAWGRAMNARKCRPISGWCSWYYYYWNISEDKLALNLEKLKQLKGTIDMVQIDDGYQPFIGEWVDWNRKFPSPAKRIVERIHDAGFMAGIWIAPFLVSRASPLYREHPDWIIRSETRKRASATDRGRPVVANLHPQWKGRVMYALDPTHPRAREWLYNSVHALMQEYGFDFLKIDFIYAASLPGKRYDPYSTGATALRQGLEVIREAVGEEKIILGCGAPLGPVIGMVDANRVSQDVDIHWDYPLVATISGIPVHPSAKNCFRNNLARAMMHNHLWTNDPDCLVLRDTKRGMSLDEICSEITLYYLSGGFMLISEDMTKLPRERLELFRQAIPLGGKAARPLDLFEKEFPEVFCLAGEPATLVALYNWSDKMKSLKLDLQALGMSGKYHVYDYWAGKYLGLVERTRDLGKVPAHGCKYLALTSADAVPCVVGLDFHLGMGTNAVKQSLGKDKKSLYLKINMPGKRKGRLLVAFPNNIIVEKDIEFENSCDFEINYRD